ncbi:MAG: hypothetical protein U0174_12440 [Polyangiaceae bacterium]
MMRVKHSAIGFGSVTLVASGLFFAACASEGPTPQGPTGTDAGPTADATTPVEIDPNGAPGGNCVTDDTCQSKLCSGGKCTAPNATDNRTNGKETDVDCGGADATTPRCASGKTCLGDSDCALKTCSKGVCSDPSGSDGKKNGTETDVDCGGPAATTPRCHAGAKCGSGADCESNVCVGKVCMKGNPFDEVMNDDETDIDCGGTRSPGCAESKSCKVATDCFSGICVSATKKCAAVHPNDGIKNGTETDIDCGGPEAPPCAANLACLQPSDCDSKFCTANKCEPRMPGRKDGDETDVDCGGKVAPKCAADLNCVADADCQSGACSTTSKKCLEGPSCRRLLGGETCGSGEVGAGANHESCCRTLKVPGFTDSNQPGKTVYLDKYEITAGRIRAFVEAISAENGGQPNIKAYMAAHRPARWNTGWEKVLPEGFGQAVESYTITNPTTNLLYPGPDKHGGIAIGNYNINTGLYYGQTAAHFFPEYTNEYSVTHALNCSNAAGSYGFGTYYFEDQVIQTYAGGISKYFSQNELDVKSANCTPFAMFAAFCAWDGGQLATDAVVNFVTNNNQRLLQNGATPACANGINSVSDSSQRCDGVNLPYVYSFPATNGVTYTGASRVAPPGRVAADVLRINPNDEPWFDLKGNLVEAVLKTDNTFTYKGYGLGYSSISGHGVQIMTPRMKGGSFGARCMRFK